MCYKIIRSELVDNQIRSIILYIAESFGGDAAINALNELEHEINLLSDKPYLGVVPHDTTLRRCGYRVLVLKKNLVFYKVDESHNLIEIHAVVDQKMDYLRILQGL